MNKVTIVIEVQEATAFAVHPIIGASGKTYGHAMYDPKRGAMAFRMSLEEWRAAKADLCLANRPFYGLVYDVEIEPEVVSASIETPAAAEPLSPQEALAETSTLIGKISNLRRKKK
jgi:hypothetical protein